MAKDKEINIQKHILVPHHEIMKQDDVDKLLSTFNVVKGQLPKISTKDPIVKILGAKENDVIKLVPVISGG